MENTIPATFSLNSYDPIREVIWSHEEPQRMDLLYYTQTKVSQRVRDIIDAIPVGDLNAIQVELSKFI